jgi:hypothetical protein
MCAYPYMVTRRHVVHSQADMQSWDGWLHVNPLGLGKNQSQHRRLQDRQRQQHANCSGGVGDRSTGSIPHVRGRTAVPEGADGCGSGVDTAAYTETDTGTNTGTDTGTDTVEVGVAMLFNPTDATLTNQTISIPL